jgi:hypothetical protein
MTIGARYVPYSNLWGEISTTIGAKPKLDLRVSRNLSEGSYWTINSSIKSWKKIPQTSFTFVRNIATGTTGFISYTPDWTQIFGPYGQSTCSIGANQSVENIQSGVEIQGSCIMWIMP